MIEKEDVEMTAEITVRRFFDNYLNNVFPEQLIAVISAHNKDVTAHHEQIVSAVKAESNRVKLWIYTVLVTVGIGGGFALARLVGN